MSRALVGRYVVEEDSRVEGTVIDQAWARGGGILVLIEDADGYFHQMSAVSIRATDKPAAMPAELVKHDLEKPMHDLVSTVEAVIRELDATPMGPRKTEWANRLRGASMNARNRLREVRGKGER